MKKYLYAIALLLAILTLTSCECKEHIFTQWETSHKATCTEHGTETRGCEKCEYTEEKTTEAFGHSFGEATLVDTANCTKPYDMASTCSVCGEIKTETIRPTGHVYDKENEELKHVITNPSCLYEGIIRYECTVCQSPDKEDLLEERTPTIDHNWVSGGCESPYYCTMCSARGADAPDHEWETYDYKCSRCGMFRAMGQG